MASFYVSYFDINIRQIELLLAILTFLATTFLGLFVFLRNPKSWTSRFFCLLALVFDVYIIFNFLSLHPPFGTQESQFFWIKMVMFSASFKGPLLLLLVHTFPGERIKMPGLFLIGILTLAFVTGIASLSSLVFSSVEYANGKPLPVVGPAMPLFFIDFVGLILVSFVVAIVRYYHSTDREKIQQFYLLAGIFIALILIGIFSLVLVVLLKTSDFVFLGPLFVTILISSIAYAIVEHQLFNIKVIATNILVVIIWIVLLGKVFVAESFVGSFVDAIILFLTIIFGVLLIKSVRKEVKQREALEALTKQLEATNAKLIELDKLKSEFLSFASHQIKTPLTAIKGWASLICDGTYGQCSTQITEACQKIGESAARMIGLVNDFLNIRKIEEGGMDYNFEETDGIKMVVDAIGELRIFAERKKLDLSFTTELKESWISVDVQRIRQVFQNLIENSIKYTDKGYVKVSVDSKEGCFIFSVSDSGHGISKELLPHLFEQYKRDKSLMQQIEGTGLGLYIAKNIVQAHKGEIWAESDGPGKGSRFLVKIPLV